MPSAQSKTDANKADDASPFALLVGSMQAKPAAQQKDTQGQDNRNDSARQDSGDRPKDDGASAQVKTSQPTSRAPVKPGKNDDKNAKKDADKTGDGAGDSQPASASLQQVDPQSLPAVQMPAQQPANPTAANSSPAATSDDISEDQPAIAVAGVAATGPASPSTQINPFSRDIQAAGQATAPQAANPIPGQTTDSKASGKAGLPAKNQASNPTSSPSAGQTSNKSAGQSADQTDQAQGQTTTIQKTAQSSGQQPATQPDGVEPSKPWQAKSQDTSNATDKGKTDSSQAASAKADDIKAATAPTSQVAATDTAAMAKSADVTTNAIASVGTTAPQPQGTPSSGTPAVVAQNVHVSTPTPNMPALAVEIAARSQSGAKQFDIRLDPPELGRVEVRLSIDATGKASAHLSADQPQTLDLLQKDAPTLTRALRDAGLDVSQNGLNFSLRQQSSDAGAGNNNPGRGGNSRSFKLAATSSLDAASASTAYRAQTSGRLDIRV